MNLLLFIIWGINGGIFVLGFIWNLWWILILRRLFQKVWLGFIGGGMLIKFSFNGFMVLFGKFWNNWWNINGVRKKFLKEIIVNQVKNWGYLFLLIQWVLVYFFGFLRGLLFVLFWRIFLSKNKLKGVICLWLFFILFGQIYLNNWGIGRNIRKICFL